MNTSLVLVDDHNLFREGLAELLASVPDFRVVGQGVNAVDAITLVHTHRPDVLLLDVEIPGPGALATIRRLKETNDQLKIVVLTMHDDVDLLFELTEGGADGYLLKTAGRPELIAAITAARRHDDVIVVSVSRTTLLQARAPARHDNGSLLSEREMQILRSLQDGGSNRQIALGLGISEATVKRHLANVYAKLGATSRLDAVRRAAQLGLT